MDHVATTVIPTGKLTLGYADLLLGGITPEMFARKPEGVETNSPAFCYGHLAIYPESLLQVIGREDLAIDASDFEEMFGFGKACLDDPDTSRYPAMDTIVSRFRERYAVAIEAVAEVPDEVMVRENPREAMRDRLPTIGAAAAFLLGGHAMMHLGQVSAWRRVMGLGPVL